VVSDEHITPLVNKALTAVLESNICADGDYILVAECRIVNGTGEMLWRWFWSPKAPANVAPVGGLDQKMTMLGYIKESGVSTKDIGGNNGTSQEATTSDD
jgi:hypothetical protein